MSANAVRLSGEDWQIWANQLLSCRYGPTEYQKVPDRDRGDAGIEGFTITDGHAYQAYGCEEPISTAERYKKQRTKMTADVRKFIINCKTLSRLFGQVKITRWNLFVPVCDSKDLVAHASAKTDEVLNARLSYVADSFRVMVCDEEQFSVERDRLLNARTRKLEVAVDEATADQITEWADKNDTFVATLDRKIARLPTINTTEARWAFRNSVLKWYLEGQDILETLRCYPETYEKIRAAKAHRENYLIQICTLGGGSPADVFNRALTTYSETVTREAYMLSEKTAESLAYEAVSDWLLRCPLDFPNGVAS
jgi:hypothetical protein